MTQDVLEMGIYNKAMLEEPMDGFDLFLKDQHDMEKAEYWIQAPATQIELEDEYALYKKNLKNKVPSTCCAD